MQTFLNHKIVLLSTHIAFKKIAQPVNLLNILIIILKHKYKLYIYKYIYIVYFLPLTFKLAGGSGGSTSSYTPGETPSERGGGGRYVPSSNGLQWGFQSVCARHLLNRRETILGPGLINWNFHAMGPLSVSQNGQARCKITDGFLQVRFFKAWLRTMRVIRGPALLTSCWARCTLSVLHSSLPVEHAVPSVSYTPHFLLSTLSPLCHTLLTSCWARCTLGGCSFQFSGDSKLPSQK